MTSSELRKLTPYEEAVLRRLLGASIEGQHQFRKQAEKAAVRTIADLDQYGSIEFKTTPALKAPSKHKRAFVPVYGVGDDLDGVPIEFDLWVKDGELVELSIVKLDASEIKKMPAVEDIEVFSTHERVVPR